MKRHNESSSHNMRPIRTDRQQAGYEHPLHDTLWAVDYSVGTVMFQNDTVHRHSDIHKSLDFNTTAVLTPELGGLL